MSDDSDGEGHAQPVTERRAPVLGPAPHAADAGGSVGAPTAGSTDTTSIRPVPAELGSVARIAAASLGAPARLVVLTPSGPRLLAASPGNDPAVPDEATFGLTATTGFRSMVVDGHRWSGIGFRLWSDAVPAALVVADRHLTPAVERILDDLAALATTVADITTAHEETIALRELLGTAAHDLRNPLSVVGASIDTLTEHVDEMALPQRERIAALATKQVERMGMLIDAMLAMHSMEDGEAREQVDLAELLRDVLESSRLIHKLADLGASSPLPTTPVLVRGIADALARLVTNLVTNAAVHGGGVVRVDLTADERHAVITIEDDGPGLPHGTPLDGGRRAHNSGGHGLGLVIARRIVDTHGGRISQRPTTHGRGTRLEIRLPLVQGSRQVRLP